MQPIYIVITTMLFLPYIHVLTLQQSRRCDIFECVGTFSEEYFNFNDQHPEMDYLKLYDCKMSLEWRKTDSKQIFLISIEEKKHVPAKEVLI